MKAELKKRWIEALRSGEYRQTRGHLRADEVVEYAEVKEGDLPPKGFSFLTGSTETAFKMSKGVGYCCLGVLCDLIKPDGWSQNDYEDQVYPAENAWGHSFDNGENMLAGDVLDDIGLNEAVQDELAQQNDGGADFDRIADLIEEEVEVIG